MADTLDTVGAARYREYGNSRTYTRETGILLLPCADGNPVSSLVHQPYSVVTVDYSATKLGSPPLVPKPKDDAVVLTHAVHLPIPLLVEGAIGPGYEYQSQGSFSTLESEPSTPDTSSYSYGRYPFRTIMDEMAELSGFPAPGAENELIAGNFGNQFALDNPASCWPQALTVLPQFFSASI